MRPTNLMLVAASLTLAACASAPNGAASSGADASASAVSNASATTITAAEIAQANVPTAYDAVDRLHRQWFHDTSAGASGDVFVYLDNSAAANGKDALRNVPAGEIARIQYLKSAEAVMRFGQQASGGAIIVTRK